MSTAGLRNGMQDTGAGVTTRSRSRLRDEADASSPAGDLHDRKMPKPQPASVPLRRSPRQAAIVASRAERQNIPTRHPEPATETPPISPSNGFVDEDSEPNAEATLRESGRLIAQDIQTSERRITPGARTSASSLPIPRNVEIIDLTDFRTAQKRKRSAVTSDDAVSVDHGDRVPDDKVRRVTRSTSKKAKLDRPNDGTIAGGSPTSHPRASSPIAAQNRRSNMVAEALLNTIEPTNTSVSTLGLSEADRNEPCMAEDEPQISEVELPQLPQCADLLEVAGDFLPRDAPVISGVPTRNLSEGNYYTSGLTPPPSSLSDEAERPCWLRESTHATEEGCESSTVDAAQHDGVSCEVLSKGEEELKSDWLDTMDSVNIPPIPSASSSAGQSTDSPRTPKSSSRYFGVDGRFLRSRKPPSSYLAPNPVRRAPRSQTARRDECRYLPHATERAGLYTFAQTRRQFPRWMKRPSHIYFRGSEFFPRGRKATEQDMDTEEVGVGMDIEGMLTSSTTRDLFQLYPSTSTDSTPQMELDPDLDPSSLLNGHSSFFSHGAAADFLGSGPGPSSVQFSSGGPFQHPQGQLWSNPCMSSQMQEPLPSGLALAGPSNGFAPVFEANGSNVSSGGAQGSLPEPPWDPSSWGNCPQFSLFGIPPLPLPPQNMSLDSSLSAMATYLVNDPLSSKTNLNSTTLNLIDGIPSAAPPWQSYLIAHSSNAADGQQ